MRIRGMMAGAPAVLSAALLASCGGDGGEDFTIAVKRPPEVVYAPLSAADPREARMVFPGLSFQRTRPSDREILYTILGTGNFPSTIRLLLEPANGGATTVIHASVHVPAVRARIDGIDKEVSERKVEAALETLLRSTGRNLEMGSSAQSDAIQLSGLLTGVAIATNKAYLDKALEFKANPEKLAYALMAFGGIGESVPVVASERDMPTVDPDAAERRSEMSQARTEWQQEEAAEKAAAPTNDLDRYDN